MWVLLVIEASYMKHYVSQVSLVVHDSSSYLHFPGCDKLEFGQLSLVKMTCHGVCALASSTAAQSLAFLALAVAFLWTSC